MIDSDGQWLATVSYVKRAHDRKLRARRIYCSIYNWVYRAMLKRDLIMSCKTLCLVVCEATFQHACVLCVCMRLLAKDTTSVLKRTALAASGKGQLPFT